MIFNIKKIDDNMFTTTIDNLGREVVNYYTNQTDIVLVEPNSQLDGGKIYCKKCSVCVFTIAKRKRVKIRKFKQNLIFDKIFQMKT